MGPLWRSFLLEMAVYGPLVAFYAWLVLDRLGDPLYRLSQEHRVWYALAALGLILAQAVGLDYLTGFLLARFRPRREA